MSENLKNRYHKVLPYAILELWENRASETENIIYIRTAV